MQHQITIGFDSIPTPLEIAARLRMTADIYAGVDAKTAAKATPTAMAAPTQAPKKTRATKPVETEETFDLGEPDIADVEIPTYDMNKDIIPAAKANRETAAKTLKALGLKSVRDLRPEQYDDFMSAVK